MRDKKLSASAIGFRLLANSLKPKAKSQVGFAVSLLLLAVVPGLLTPVHRGLLMKILIWGLYAMAFDLLYGYTGLLSLGQSVYFGLGAYGAALTLMSLKSFWLAILWGIGVASVAAGVIGSLAVRVRGHGFIIITAVTSLLFYLLAQDRDELTGGDEGLNLPPMPLQIKDWAAACTDPGPAYYFVLIFVAISFLVLSWLVRTPFGLALRAIGENEPRAELIGYSTNRLKLIAFVISGAFSALAGSLYALTSCHVSTNLFHWLVSADAIVWTLLGGAGTLIGPLLGTFLLMIAREMLSAWWGYGYPILVGILIIFIVRFASSGIVG